MDPFARKMVRSSVIYGAVLVLMFAVLTVFYLHLRPRCTDQVISSSASPDGKWIAVVMERRCGEEAPFSMHVNLRATGEPLTFGYFSGAATQGEVFRIEQDAQSANTSLTWTAPDRLAIGCEHCQIAFLKKKAERWNKVSISYFFDQQ